MNLFPSKILIVFFVDGLSKHSEDALGLVIGLDTVLTVWEALKNAYAQDSQEHEFTLRQQLTYLRKEDDKIIGEHIHIFKGLCDNLAAIRKAAPNKEKVFVSILALALNMKPSQPPC